MKKTLALLLALIMLVSLFAACGKKDDGGAQPDSDKGTVTSKPSTDPSDKTDVSVKTETVNIESDEVKVYPSDDAVFKFASQANITYVTQAGNAFGPSGTSSLFFGEGLLRWNSDTNEVEPFLAESYEWTDDTTMRLHLRKDVTSILGDPFTASDVLYTFLWNNETKALTQYYAFFDYEKTKVVDDYTLDLVVKNPYPFLPLDLCHGPYHIVVEASVDKLGGKAETQLNPNACTGPYKMTKLDEVSQVLYGERRDDYWGIMPYYKFIEVHAVTDANTRAMAIESGDLNFAMNPASASVEAADGKTSKGWYVPAAGRFYYINFNSNNDPLNITEIRQAIALAINYQALLQVANANHGILSDCAIGSPLNPNSYTPVSDPAKCFVGRTDIELAKQKLIDAGYPGGDGLEFKMIYGSTDAQGSASAELIKNNLNLIGISIDLAPGDSATLTTVTLSGDWDLRLTITGNANPKRVLNMLDGRRQTMDKVTGCCGERWYPDFDVIEGIIDRCVQTVDDEARMKAFAEFNDITREYVPMITLYCPYVSFLTSPDITNLPIGSQGGPECCRIFPNEYLEG